MKRFTAREILKRGSEVASTLVHLTASTTTVGKVGALIGVASAIIGEAPDLASRYETCETLDIHPRLGEAVARVLLDLSRLEAGDTDGKQRVWSIPAGNGSLAWIHDRSVTGLRGPWLINVDRDGAREALGRAVWEALGPRIAVDVRRWGESVALAADDLASSLPSGQSRELATELGLYTKKNIQRSVLLHGPSRTGKSFIVRDVADRLGSFSLRFTSQGWGGEDVLVSAVKLLQPKSLIMDDLCRSATTPMLDAMERVRSSVPTVLATANYTEKIDPALLGPGRFDRTILVERIDEETFAALTADLDEDLQRKLRSAPVGYLAEFLLELDVEGEDVARGRLDDLLDRAERSKAAPPPDRN